MEDEKAAAKAQKRADGLSDEHGAVCDHCVALFRDTQFTAAMLCLAVSMSPDDATDILRDLHAWGYVRCPDNDGGQVLYQVMPGVVHPKGK